MSQALDRLNNELGLVSKKIRQQLLLKAICEGLAYLLMGLIVFFVLDRLGDFPLAFRILVLITGLFSILYYLKSKYWIAYSHPYTKEDISLLVENKFPEFRSRMISTLQFSKNKPGKMVSTDLVQGMMNQTFEMVDDCDFSQAVDSGPFKKALKQFSIALACILMVSVISPQYFGVYLQRFISQVAYPTKTQFSEIQLPEYAIAGEVTPLNIKMSGDLAPSGYLTIFSSGDSAEYDIVQSDEEGIYNFDIPAQMSDLSLKFKIGDFSSQEYDLPIKKRPAIAEMKIQVSPPAYTGMSKYEEQSGNIQVPLGSVLSFSIKTTKDLEKFEFESKIAELPQIKGQATDWNFELIAQEKMNYTFRMKDKDALTSKEIPEFRLRVKTDKAPRVRVIEPAALRELSPISKMPLEAEFEDDYQISEIKVLYTVIDSEYDSGLDFEEFKVWKSFEQVNSKTFKLKELWDNRSIDIEAGKNLKIRLQVTDNSPEAQVSFSEDLMIPIISQEELKSRLADEFINTIEPVEDILLKLNDVNRKMDRLGDK